jgi:hypothetical protein
MSVAETMEATAVTAALVPAGSPVVHGRVHLGRLRSQLPNGPLSLLVGFGTVAWLGDPTSAAPDLGRMVYRRTVELDGRGRLALDRQARAWLTVSDAASFDALVMSAPGGGLVVVPVEDFGRRASTVAA